MVVVDNVLLPMFTNREAYSFYKVCKRLSKTKLVILIQQLTRNLVGWSLIEKLEIIRCNCTSTEYSSMSGLSASH